MKHRDFWLLAGSFFVCGASTNGLVQTHFISLCGDYGLAAVTAASVLALKARLDAAPDDEARQKLLGRVRAAIDK